MTETSYKKFALEILSELSAIQDEPHFAYLCHKLRLQLLEEDQKRQQQQQYIQVQQPRSRLDIHQHQQMVADNGSQQQEQQNLQQQQLQQNAYITAEAFFGAASDVVKRRAPSYKTSVFACMDDYEK